MSPEIAVLLGVAIGSFGTLAVTWITTKADERKHIQSLIYQAGVENFKEACAMTQNNDKLTGVAPMEHFIINMVKISQLLSKNQDFSDQELKEMLKEANRTAVVLSEFCKKEGAKP